METLRQYVISISIAAWAVGCFGGMIQNKSAKALIRLIGGLFLAIMLLNPLSDLDWEDLIERLTIDYPDSRACISTGVESSREALAAVIVSKTEAYILDKAKSLNADITVEIRLSSDEIPIPTEARIRGEFSSQVHQALSSVMEHELGITKEKQIWIS